MLNSILLIIAGFGTFLFGLHTFSNNIEKISGNKMRQTINKFSGNRFSAVGSGFVFTSILQSSTAGITMIAGFTSAGLISLFQGVSLALGSGMASFVPNFLISFTTFNIKEIFCAFAGVGILLFILSKKPLLKNIATAIIGFSLIFIGMTLIGDGASVFSTNPSLINFFHTLTNPFLLILLGVAFTLITQSSLATVAFIMTLVGTASVTGIITIESAAYLVYGANLGSAFTTAFLISFSSNINGKRIGLFHILVSLLGVIVFSLISLLPWISYLFSWVTEPTFKIAFINLSFNLLTGLIVLPLLRPSIYLIRKILPGRRSSANPLEINDIKNESIQVSLAKVNEKLILFFDTITTLYSETIEYVTLPDSKKYKKIFDKLTEYDELVNKFNFYVIRVATDDDSLYKEIERLINSIKQIERITRNCLKIISLLDKNKKFAFSLKLKKFIDSVTQNTKTMFELTKQFIIHPDCKFLINESPSSYEKILTLSHENSETKITAKTFVIENGFNNKLSTEKNTSFIELMSYFGLISNNILDLIFPIIGQANCTINKKYEQLILDGLPPEDKQ